MNGKSLNPHSWLGVSLLPACLGRRILMHYTSNFDSRPLRNGEPWRSTLDPFDGLVGKVEDLLFA